MNNLSSYCGLVDAKTRASEKDLPVRMYVYSATTHRLFVIAKVNTDAMLPSRRCHSGRICLIMCKNYEAFLPSKSVQITIYTDLDGKISKRICFQMVGGVGKAINSEHLDLKK